MNELKEILVVDAQPGGKGLINNELKRAGFHTVLAQNSAEALMALWEKQDIDVVLLDLPLPVINGLNIFEIIRKYFPGKRIIINSVLQKDDKRFFSYDTDNEEDRPQGMANLIEKIANAFKGKSKIVSMNVIEKRDSKRVPVNILATCEKDNEVLSPAYVYFHTCIKDLSLSGGRFVVVDDIKTGGHFKIALKLPDQSLPLLIDCEAVWVKGIEVGARFIKFDSPHDQEKLKKFLGASL